MNNSVMVTGVGFGNTNSGVLEFTGGLGNATSISFTLVIADDNVAEPDEPDQVQVHTLVEEQRNEGASGCAAL